MNKFTQVCMCVRLGERQRKRTRKRERENDRIKREGGEEEIETCVAEA